MTLCIDRLEFQIDLFLDFIFYLSLSVQLLDFLVIAFYCSNIGTILKQRCISHFPRTDMIHLALATEVRFIPNIVLLILLVFKIDHFWSVYIVIIRTPKYFLFNLSYENELNCVGHTLHHLQLFNQLVHLFLGNFSILIIYIHLHLNDELVVLVCLRVSAGNIQ